MRLKTESTAKKIAEEYANKVWNHKEINTVDQLVHPDVLIHSLLGDFKGTKAIKEVIKTWLDGFPDIRVHNDLVITENDLVSIQWSVTATHKGEFKGVKPTGKSVTYSGVTVYRVKNGKIVEYWAYIDMQHLLDQLKA
jgi:steroid delta-isomerase-like uncharacterized protein